MPLCHLEMCIYACACTQTLKKASHKEGPGLCHLETTHGFTHLNMALLSCIKAKIIVMLRAEKEFSILAV